MHCAGPHHKTTSTRQYLAVLVDYAWPYRQQELELLPHVVLGPHPAGSYGSATRPHVKEQTGTQYSSVFLQGRGIVRRFCSSTKDYPSWSEPFRQSLPSCGNPVTNQIQTLPRVLIFTEPDNRCLDSQSDRQTQANSLLCQSVLIGMPSRSSLLHPLAQSLRNTDHGSHRSSPRAGPNNP